jgi:hypothetical protein
VVPGSAVNPAARRAVRSNPTSGIGPSVAIRIPTASASSGTTAVADTSTAAIRATDGAGSKLGGTAMACWLTPQRSAAAAAASLPSAR